MADSELPTSYKPAKAGSGIAPAASDVKLLMVTPLEESDDTRALVLELVEGPTLADRIKQGPIPVDEALHIAKQNEPTDPHGPSVRSEPSAANPPLAEEGS